MSGTAPFRGSGVALLTPFHEDGGLDLDAYRGLVAYQIEGGTDFLVPCGSTGEAGALTATEQRTLVECAVEASGGRAPILAGAGSMSTAEVVRLARAAEEAGADGVLAGSPPYSRPPQSGLRAHFEAVAAAVDIPIVVYNVPSRTAVNLLPETVLELARIENVVAVKEASGDLEQIYTLIRESPDGFSVIAGDDELTLPILSLGGDGSISVIANEVPAAFSFMVHRALEGRLDEARAVHEELVDLMRANFIESNPIPAKAAMAAMGLLSDRVRLPLVPATSKARAAVEPALARARKADEQARDDREREERDVTRSGT